MIRKLKRRFITLSVTSLFVLLTVLVVGMNIVNYTSVVREADLILSLLSNNKGRFPINDVPMEENKENRFPPNLSPELPYEVRYFSVLLSDTGEVLYTETSRIFAVDQTLAVDYAEQVLESEKKSGFIEHYRFIRQTERNSVRITFLDCGRQLDVFRNFLFISAGIALGGFVIVFLVICFFAGRIVRPIAESYEKQKRFITDAGHEIRTPLAIIQANVDVLEMEIGNNEALTDISQQAKRMTSLTNDLVYLARMEETNRRMTMIEFPVSEIVSEAASSFGTLAELQGKQLICRIQPLLSMNGDVGAIEQLVSILLDNALKYSSDSGTISMELSGQNRSVTLTVYNTTKSPLEPETMNHVFDRFWRADPSRNSATGGHGIGLSIAQAIVASHHGKIHARARNEYTFEITASFPV